MPNRILREGFLRSDKINLLKENEQIFFIRLLLVADDFGCFDARPEIVKSYCYPLSDIRLSIVSQMMAALQKTDLITIYEESGKKYVFIKNFDQRLRQKRRKYPQPPDNIEDTKYDRQLSDGCQTIDGRLHARMPESESESESEEKRIKNLLFNKWYSIYPNKKNRGDAEKAWKQIKEPEIVADKIITALGWQMKSEGWLNEEGKYIPYPATYVRARKWEDEPHHVLSGQIFTGTKIGAVTLL